jgi:CubicO group peptidase (beta-lactamase class C family)
VNYTSLFRADVLDTSKSVVAKYGLTRAELDSEMNRLVNPNEAYLPIFVSAGGVTTPTAENRRYSAVWSRHLSAAGRSMSKTGDSRALGVDAVIENIMAINGVRHATLAIVRDKKLLYARAFTRAEQTYALAWPTTHFRLASCSKMLTAMLVMNLIEKKDIPPLLDGSGKVLTAAIDRRLSDFLPLTTLNGSPPTDARFTSITIRQLLEHHSGLAKTYSPWSVVRPGVFMPPSQAQWCSYAAEQTLEFTPGTGKVLFSLDPIIWQREYSNVGYMLLGRMCRSIVRKLPGRGAFSFLDVLKERSLTPLGITRCRVFTALDGNQAAEARYDSAVLNVGPSVVTTQPTMYPMPYGADMDPNAWEASGGLTMAAPDYAKVLACFSVGADPMVVDKVLTEASRDFMLSNRVGFDGGDAMFSAWKGGMLMGAQTQLHVVKGGISFIVCFSRDFDSSPINANFPDLRAAVDAESWPINHDLFPTPGIDIPAL